MNELNTKKSTGINKTHRKKFGVPTGKKMRRVAGNKLITNRSVVRVPSKLQPSSRLNLDFHAVAEGVYTSYWVGKFINMLQQKGNKKIAARSVYVAFSILKYQNQTSALLIFLELLDKVKPIFRLRNYIVRRSVIKEYPIIIMRPRQIILAIHWLKEEIQNSKSFSDSSFARDIATKLLDFKSAPYKNALVKKRAEYLKRTVKAQFNIRYNFK